MHKRRAKTDDVGYRYEFTLILFKIRVFFYLLNTSKLLNSLKMGCVVFKFNINTDAKLNLTFDDTELFDTNSSYELIVN